MTDADAVLTAADVEAARERIEGVVHRTPLDGSRTFARRSGASAVGLKLENMQRAGSFKIRGAYNTMSQLPEAERERGVVAASAGNHAQGVALAGRLLGIDATIVVPEITPAAKIEATREYGAEVVVHGDIYERAYEHALELADRRGSTFVHPFNDAAVIAGQGTIGLEIAEQFPDPDTVLVAIGGGGLVSGIATALKDRHPEARVVGVQAEGAAHAGPSLRRGEIHELADVDTIADGIADVRLLEETFAVMTDRVDEVVTVTDGEIAVAMALLAERAKTVAEPAGAAPVAALSTDGLDVTDERVAVVVSGGNANLTDHAELTRAGLARLGRHVRARVGIDDWPAGIDAVTEIAREEGAEIDALERVPLAAGDDPNRRPVELGLEGSGPEHLRGVLEALDAREGITVVESDLSSPGDAS